MTFYESKIMKYIETQKLPAISIVLLLLLGCGKDDRVYYRNSSSHTDYEEKVSAGHDDLKSWHGEVKSDINNKRITFSGSRDESKDEYHINFDSQLDGGVKVKMGGTLGEPMPVEIASIQDPVRAFQDAETADKNQDFEKAYQLSKQALMIIKGDEKTRFIVLHETLRRGAYLMSINYKDHQQAEHVNNLAREHIRMIENWGGLSKVIESEKWILNAGIDDPQVKGDIENTFVAGYFMLGLTADKNTAQKCYDTIKDHAPDHAQLLKEVMSAQ